MPATVSQVVTGLAANLATISGLRTFTYQPEQLNPPVAFPVIDSIEYHGAMGGGDVQMRFNVFVIVGRYLDRTAHATLDAFLSYSGASSVRAALESDRTLGGVAQTLIVESSTSISSLTVAEADYLQIVSTVIVHA